MLAQAGVFCGELLYLNGQGLVFCAFLLPAREAVASVDDVPGEEHGYGKSGDGDEAASVGDERLQAGFFGDGGVGGFG